MEHYTRRVRTWLSDEQRSEIYRATGVTLIRSSHGPYDDAVLRVHTLEPITPQLHLLLDLTLSEHIITSEDT